MHVSNTGLYTTTFGIYFLAMIAIGLWFYRSNRDLSDYVLGGRTLNYYVTALSAMASDLSGWLLLGLPGAAYATGLSSVWILVGLFAGLYINWRVIAARLRTYSQIATDFSTGQQGDALTLSAYFENRFEDRSHLLRLLSAVTIIIFFTIYVASGLVAGGTLFQDVFGVDPAVGMLVTLAVIVVYTFVGGFLAVSYTDSVQALLMWAAVIGVPVIVVGLLGGFGAFADAVSEHNPGLLSLTDSVSFADGAWSTAGTVSLVTVVSGLAWGPGYFGQPHILARFMGIRSAADIPRARRIGVTYGVTGMGAAVLIGLVGVAYLDRPLSNPESVFLRLVDQVLPPWIGGLALVGVLAAVMSTASSQLLVVASALCEDFYRRFFNRQASGTHLMWFGRFMVVGISLVSAALAMRGGSVLDLVAYAWAGFGAAFGTVLMASLFWRGMNRVGAIAGMVGGAVAVLVYKQLDTLGLYEMVPGVLCSFLCMVLFNRLGSPPSARMLADFDTVAGAPTARAAQPADTAQVGTGGR